MPGIAGFFCDDNAVLVDAGKHLLLRTPVPVAGF